MQLGRDGDRRARPRGRPRDAGPSAESRASVSTWLPSGAHDRLIALAKAEERSISSVVRRLLILQLPAQK